MYEFKEKQISGVYEIIPKFFSDNRGSVNKIYHKPSYTEKGLECEWGEILVTENAHKNIVRGFHFQRPPYCQVKTIYCACGSIRNVVLDIRKGSPTYGKTEVVILDSNKKNVLYVPKGIANFYEIMQDNTVIVYHLSSVYMPEYEDGIRWDTVPDLFEINNPILSQKDQGLQDYNLFDSPFVFGENC